jgi:hypothetical protein
MRVSLIVLGLLIMATMVMELVLRNLLALRALVTPNSLRKVRVLLSRKVLVFLTTDTVDMRMGLVRLSRLVFSHPGELSLLGRGSLGWVVCKVL